MTIRNVIVACDYAYIEAVSYTHLDVYKRQSMECPKLQDHLTADWIRKNWWRMALHHFRPGRMHLDVI